LPLFTNYVWYSNNKYTTPILICLTNQLAYYLAGLVGLVGLVGVGRLVGLAGVGALVGRRLGKVVGCDVD
jgi:hypothetical protein